MSKTNELRALVQGMLKTKCDKTYYEAADQDALFPHCVFEFGNIINDDLSRDDITIDIDVWDRSKSAVVIEDLCDEIEALFNNSNLPQDGILPTFFHAKESFAFLIPRILSCLCSAK